MHFKQGGRIRSYDSNSELYVGVCRLHKAIDSLSYPRGAIKHQGSQLGGSGKPEPSTVLSAPLQLARNCWPVLFGPPPPSAAAGLTVALPLLTQQLSEGKKASRARKPI